MLFNHSLGRMFASLPGCLRVTFCRSQKHGGSSLPGAKREEASSTKLLSLRLLETNKPQQSCSQSCNDTSSLTIFKDPLIFQGQPRVTGAKMLLQGHGIQLDGCGPHQPLLRSEPSPAERLPRQAAQTLHEGRVAVFRASRQGHH